MSNKSIIPQTKWLPIPQSKKEFVEGDTNRAFLAIGDSYLSSYTSPEIIFPAGENRLVISCVTHRMYCIDTTTGKIMWTAKEHGSINGGGDFKQTCYHNGVIYTGIVDTYFTAIDPATGEYLWKVGCGRKESSFCSPFQFRDDKVYFSSGDTAFCINLSTHKIEWKTKVEEKEGINCRLPFFWKNYIIYPSAKTGLHLYQEDCAKKHKFKFYFINIETGAIESTKDLKNLPRETNFPLYVVDDIIWFVSDDYTLHCYDLPNGKADELKLGSYSVYGEGQCFILNKSKIYMGMRVGKERGMFCYDITTKELKKIFDDNKDFDDNLSNINWIEVGDYMYGYYYENFSDKVVYSLSLADLTLKKYPGVPQTGDEEVDEMFNPIKGFNVTDGVCYVATQFDDGDDDENARVCLWAFWK